MYLLQLIYTCVCVCMCVYMCVSVYARVYVYVHAYAVVMYSNVLCYYLMAIIV